MSKQNATALNEDGLMLSGYQKKLKTMKKKYFVLYEDTLSKVARLEYYDNERKFKSGLSPKRVIKLENCFNINRRLDTKYDYVIALSTKDGGFGIVLESEEEMLKWLEVLLALQRRGFGMSDVKRPQFEHVWQVSIQRKGLAEDKGITGSYHVCLTPKSVTFIRIGAEKNTSGDVRTTNVEIPLNTIRRCGDSQCFFYMEVGRQCSIGPGELWMETDDTMIAQNMHRMISSAMSAKTDANLEPMRKRSSSATEASKPLNAFHKKSNQPENKTFNSPQTTSLYYGRERCDSFPSRNRTSSECSNQSFTASSVHTRNTMLSGHRPPPYQRHSISPPVTSAVGCSESEESSISIDEADDNASFLYRFNSRSSDGVIPEENTDELTCSESKYSEVSVADNSDKNCPEGGNYVSMAPVKINKDAVEIKKLNPLKSTIAANELKCVSSSSSLTCVHKTDFQEYSSDNVSKTYSNELDLQSERPTRAYSIGSKIEHNKINKRIGNTNDSEPATTRVRAFSVGSRAKIPRCDLQRTILFPKYLIEKNFNSNNNLCSVADANACNQLLNTNATRDKKSTSAPILIHKSHNSVDRMSDLMEIDFSKSPHYSSSRIQQSKTKPHLAKNTSSTSREPVKKQDNITISVCHDESLLQTGSSSLPSTHQPIVTADSGYLEMKPVGSSLNTPSPINMSNTYNASIEYTPNKPKMADSTVLANKAGEFEKRSMPCPVEINNKIETARTFESKIDDVENTSSLSKSAPCKCTFNSENQRSHVSNDALMYNNHANNMQTQNANAINLSSQYSQLTLKSTTKENSEKLTDDYINIDNKKYDLDPDIFRDNKKTKSKCRNALTDNGKIPNPLNDTIINYGDLNASKQTAIRCIDSEALHQPFNRPFLYKEKQLRCRQNQNNPSLISSTLSSSSTLRDSTSTSPSLPYSLPLTQSQSQSSNSKESHHSPINVKPELNVTSRPSSLSSEHELHYASLDLPPCRTDNIKTHKIDDDATVFAAVSVNNSYAKIDFDHSSDSSSSSSKNLNI